MKVLIADQFEQSGIDAIAAIGCEVFYEPALADQQLAAALAHTRPDVLVVRSTKVTESMLADTSLSLIVRAGAGVNTIDVAAASSRGI
jgi:D-3-phosphoglycerate dehydrogenase